jgi:hypothetical protein
VEEPSRASRATIAIYDRPPWWKRRRTWMIALPIVVAVASVAVFAFLT